MTRFHAEPTIPNTFVAPFQKVAIFGFLTRTLPRLAGRAFSGLTPTSLARPFHPAATGIERGLIAGGNKLLSPEHAATFARTMRGVPRNAVREAISNSLIGGVLEGGINAYTADPGQGAAGFVHGFGSGAASGALFGGVSGAAGGAVRNMRGINMSSLAKQHNMARPEMAKKVKAMGTWDALKGSFGKTDGLDRQIARHKTLGGISQLGAEMALPMAILPGSSEPEPPPPAPSLPKPPTFAPNTPSVYSQPQGFKGGSVSSLLKPIDLTKIPSYHR